MHADDMILISVDDHIAEPADMFRGARAGQVPRRGAPSRNGRARIPTMVVWRQEGSESRPERGSLGSCPRMFNVNPTNYSEMRAGCYDVHERVRDMSAGGTLAGLNFPNWTGFSGQVLNEGPDPVVNEAMIRAYNDWHVDEWCASYPDRFIPCGILPLFDVHKAADEVRRLAGKGRHAVTFSEIRRLSTCRRSTQVTGTLSLLRARTSAPSCACTSVRLPKPRQPPLRTRLGGHGALVGDVDLFAGRSVVGRFLVALSRPDVLAHGGRHRVDPVFPPAGRAHSGTSLRLDGAEIPRRHGPGRTCSNSGSSAASSTIPSE